MSESPELQLFKDMKTPDYLIQKVNGDGGRMPCGVNNIRSTVGEWGFFAMATPAMGEDLPAGQYSHLLVVVNYKGNGKIAEGLEVSLECPDGTVRTAVIGENGSAHFRAVKIHARGYRFMLRQLEAAAA